MCSSFNVRDHVPHPHKTTGKIIILNILIFEFLDSRLEDGGSDVLKLLSSSHVRFPVFDSSAKLPAGILNGNVNQYGDFDQCLDVAAELDPVLYSHLEDYHIAGKYCLAHLDLGMGSTSRPNTVLKEVDDLAHAHRPIVSTVNDVSYQI
jgi:hypothetical protein